MIAALPLPQLRGQNQLTHTRMSVARTCLRRHYLQYELGLRRDRIQPPLRLGSAVHHGLDQRAIGYTAEEAMAAAGGAYDDIPVWVDEDEIDNWLAEQQIVIRLLEGYFRHWDPQSPQILASEMAFDLPIRNPDTGRKSPVFRVAGKIDKIIRLPDGRLAVMEHKTTSESIESGSDYWARLAIDQQISLYLLAARQLGFDVQTVLYDVIRKPSIKPRLVKGVRETAVQYGQRLASDIVERPDWYFARQEIPRLANDLAEFERELWQTQRILADCRRHGRWVRNTAACLHPYRCTYTPICFGMLDPTTHPPPPGFLRLECVHPELEAAEVSS